ncbi:hypothetical protein [Streptantibioticus silvisoli]|uniref:Uncharacterized protein n=1 Tax=Streptantibioticus silvisoli TaxID=2705255 RepID=A0ABT6W245_9ACTN|nr:hypothetical protein [Streptantibioticus silvisoli]MDI5964816.1 hypothetical protein [Streptantibioticus silvisoli]
MGVITPEVRAEYGGQIRLIPSDMITRLPQEELLDRLAEAKRLHTKAAKAETPYLAIGYHEKARLLCKAEPRDETELLAREWVAKAAAAHTGVLASACLEKAEEIRRSNPAAPRVTPVVQTAEMLEKAEAVTKLRQDVARKAAAAGREAAQRAAEDRKYADALAGRRVWTLGDQLRWNREHDNSLAT